jgi:hypothetical protein
VLRWRWQQLKIRARVCAAKGVLASDRRIERMTPTRWLFEAWQLKLTDDQRSETIQHVAQQGLKGLMQVIVHTLGLNLEPIAEPDPTDPEKTRYRFPKDEEFTPLILAVARRDYVEQAMEKVKEIVNPNDVLDPTLDRDLDEEELQFLDDMSVDEKKLFWESFEAKEQLKRLVIPADVNAASPYAQGSPEAHGPRMGPVPSPVPAPAPKPGASRKLRVEIDDAEGDDGNGSG